MSDSITFPASYPQTRVQRFPFVSFGQKDSAPAPETVPPAPVADQEESLLPPVPVITEEDLEKAKTAAHAQGYHEGVTAAESRLNHEQTARDGAVQSLLEVIANRITLAAEEHASEIKSRGELMGRLVLAISRKLAGEALRREPYACVELLLRECMALVAGSPTIQITVSPHRSEGLRQRVDTLRPLLGNFEGEMRVGADADLEDQDCRVEWKNGYAERSEQALWKEIETLVGRSALTQKE